ncbi:MAG: hypothetical protein XD77_1528 [Marinimicrobia bacterium 46_47]|nr:MAG: hypothetical protein XD77_1528 [Marinimicrobia bacterium 46_47]
MSSAHDTAGFASQQSAVGSQKSGRRFFERCETTVEFLNIEQCEMIEC